MKTVNMALSGYNVTNILREWAPLTDLFNKLPSKSQIGIFSQDIKLTCLDVLPEFIALGTNVGIVYWYDRKKRNLERLRCENTNIPITVVKIISTVDFMVACGNRTGNISIFQIPKTHPEDIPASLKPKNKQVERYTVADLHKSSITALEWAKNGMKLFSGDKNGSVVLTELDFYMHICKSVEILNEAYEVVQISYNHQKLLISTTYRSIICQQADKWKVCQVGKKDRKVLGNFGGLIFQNSPKPSDSILYCTRPGLRIWISDIEGNVQTTLLFKDLLSHECPEVPIVNPISRNLRELKPQKEPSFGVLLLFNDNLLVTHNNDVVYILDPRQITILYMISQLRGVLSIATHKDELFILEEDRSVIRISFKPEPSVDTSPTTPIYGLPQIPLSIKDIASLTTKLQNSSIITAIPSVFENNEVNTGDQTVISAEEAKESPIRKQPRNPPPLQKFEDIGKQEFNDKILYKSNKIKKKHNSMTSSMISLSSTSSDEKEYNNLSYTKPTIMNLSAVDVLPDLRSPESIQSDIEYKEKILADFLHLDKVKIDLGNLSSKESEKNCDESTMKVPAKLNQKTVTATIENDRKHCQKANNPPEDIRTSSSKGGKENLFKRKVSKEIDIPSTSSVTPAMRNIPKEWNLKDIQLNTQLSRNSASDTSLADWEII